MGNHVAIGVLGMLGVASVGLAACAPMYGAASEPMRNPKTIASRAEAPAPPPAYVDECRVDFQKVAPRGGVARNERAAARLVDTGDATRTRADAAVEPHARGDLLRETVERYASALVQDPYNADATLKLALAYDRVYRKGCALALLRRLVALTGNRKFAPEATADINRVDDNKQWFKDYRQEALRAIGH